LNQATANATGRPVLTGPVEATVIGNLVVQAVTAGRFADLAAARRYVADRLAVRVVQPAHSTSWNRLQTQYDALEAEAALA
jgi:rhamnulokinase